MSLIPWSRRTSALPTRLGGLPEISDMFENMFNGWPSFAATNGDGSWMPAIDIKDDDKHVSVTAELPGVTRDDVKIEVSGNRLTLRGEKKEEKTEKKDNWWHREASYGSFMRQVTLPVEVDAEHAEAKMDNGVLRVRLPKLVAAKTKAIKVG